MCFYHVIGPSTKDKRQDSFEHKKRKRRENLGEQQEAEEEGQGEALGAHGEEEVQEEVEDQSEEEVLNPMTLAKGETVMKREK